MPQMQIICRRGFCTSICTCVVGISPAKNPSRNTPVYESYAGKFVASLVHIDRTSTDLYALFNRAICARVASQRSTSFYAYDSSVTHHISLFIVDFNHSILCLDFKYLWHVWRTIIYASLAESNHDSVCAIPSPLFCRTRRSIGVGCINGRHFTTTISKVFFNTEAISRLA